MQIILNEASGPTQVPSELTSTLRAPEAEAVQKLFDLWQDSQNDPAKPAALMHKMQAGASCWRSRSPTPTRCGSRRPSTPPPRRWSRPRPRSHNHGGMHHPRVSESDGQ